MSKVPKNTKNKIFGEDTIYLSNDDSFFLQWEYSSGGKPINLIGEDCNNFTNYYFSNPIKIIGRKNRTCKIRFEEIIQRMSEKFTYSSEHNL